MHPIRVGLRVPPQHLDERAGVRWRRNHGPDWGPRLGDGLGPGRRRVSDRSGQVARSLGGGHDRIRQADPELLLEPQEQLDLLETADAGVSIEGVLRSRRPSERRPAQLGHEPLDQLEHPSFNGVALDPSGNRCHYVGSPSDPVGFVSGSAQARTP